jgi:N-hydroxyarylamine O-acetyltransferase
VIPSRDALRARLDSTALAPPAALSRSTGAVATMPSLHQDHVDRYLRVLGVRRRPPSLDALSELVAAHVRRIPFENVSKIHRWKRMGLCGLPDVELYLDGVERSRLGGTCYANNVHLCSLLASLGYDARLCAADMHEPDLHLVIMVTLGELDHLVDVGYGAPFLAPFPLDAAVDQVVADGRDSYVLKPRDLAGRSRLEHHRDGRLVHGYLAKPEARRLEDFGGVIARSFLPEATFMNAVVLTRFSPGRSISFHNLTLVESAGGRSVVTTLPDRAALIEALVRLGDIPEAVAAEVVADVRGVEVPWG